MSENRTRTLDDSTHASDPGQIRLSHKRLKVLRPDLYGIRGLWKRLRRHWPERVYIEDQLQEGDSRAAVVMTVSPLMIAAYTDELDCVAMLRFPDEIAREHNLSAGTRLLTVNCYGQNPEIDADLIPGPEMIERWTTFHPIIAELVTDDRDRLEARKREISEDEWRRAGAMGREYMKRRPGVARDGRPVHSMTPADDPRAMSAGAHYSIA